MKPRNNVLLLALLGLLVFAAVRREGDDPDKPTPEPPGPNTKRCVLVFAETGPSPPYTHAQDVALASVTNGDLRAWIDANCKPDGLRVFDPQQDVSGQGEFWQKAFADAATSKTPLPWVRTHNGWRWSKERPITNIDDLKSAIGAK